MGFVRYEPFHLFGVVLLRLVLDSLRWRWPVTWPFCLLILRCLCVFALVLVPMTAGPCFLLLSWVFTTGVAFSPFAVIVQVLARARSSRSLGMSPFASLVFSVREFHNCLCCWWSLLFYFCLEGPPASAARRVLSPFLSIFRLHALGLYVFCECLRLLL